MRMKKWSVNGQLWSFVDVVMGGVNAKVKERIKATADSDTQQELNLKDCEVALITATTSDAQQLEVLSEKLVKKLAKQFPRLAKLDLSNNRIPFIPPEISRFNNLQILILSENEIEKLSENITLLPRLETLEVEGNGLSMLPSGWTRHCSLKTLNISGNSIQACVCS